MHGRRCEANHKHQIHVFYLTLPCHRQFAIVRYTSRRSVAASCCSVLQHASPNPSCRVLSLIGWAIGRRRCAKCAHSSMHFACHLSDPHPSATTFSVSVQTHSELDCSPVLQEELRQERMLADKRLAEKSEVALTRERQLEYQRALTDKEVGRVRKEYEDLLAAERKAAARKEDALLEKLNATSAHSQSELEKARAEV